MYRDNNVTFIIVRGILRIGGLMSARLLVYGERSSGILIIM